MGWAEASAWPSPGALCRRASPPEFRVGSTKTPSHRRFRGSGSQRGHHSNAIAPVAMGVLVELGVADLVPAFNAPAISDPLQQRLWRCAEAGEEQMGGVNGLAVTGAGGRDFNDPAGSGPGLADVLKSLFGPQHPSDVPAVTDLVIRCHERELALSLELAANLAEQRLLVGESFGEVCVYNLQEEVGPLLLKLAKNGRWV